LLSVAIYLFTGPEIGERDEAISALKKSLQKTCGELDAHTFYMVDARLSDVILLLENESLFASARFVVLHNAELITKKDDVERIAAWAKGASRSVLVLASLATSVDRKLSALVPKGNTRVFWELFDSKKEDWLRNFFRRAGYGVESDAVSAILEMVENNTSALAAECSRFFLCFDKGHTVTQADIDNVLTHNREESAFTLFDALADSPRPPAARLESAAEILETIRAAKNSASQALIAGLAYCFRRLKDWHHFRTEHPSPTSFDYKVAGFGSVRVQTQYRKAAEAWKPAETDAALALLAKTDAELRAAGSGLEDTLLSLLLYGLVIKRGQGIDARQTA
jgi:DNA polymerase-3 subunit delta